MSANRNLWSRSGIGVVLALTALAVALGCGAREEAASPEATTAVQGIPEPVELPEPTPLPAGLAPLIEPFTGDLDGMLERRIIRVLTVQNPILYFVDQGREVGLTYEAIKAFEGQLNSKLGKKVVTVHVITIPVARDELIPRLLAGQGDIAAAQLAITPERQQQVDFSDPFLSGVREVLVTGPGAPPVASLEDLSGKEVYVRLSSSYAEHLRRLNAHFEAAGKPPVTILPAEEVLEDGDILEMVNAGLVPATVTDEFMADLYVQVFPSLTKRSDIASQPVAFAWAFRKGSPQLAAEINAFVKTHQQGTLAGNVLLDKYLKTTKWVKNARSDEDRQRFVTMVDLFKKYGDEYGLDYLLMAAQAYQESGLDQSKRSHMGAVGVMQILPSTASDKAVAIPDIEKLESNIHAGIKYNRWMIDTYYNEPGLTPLNRGLLAFASYNAGPAKVAALRRQAAAEGLDPNKWFNNVELIAAKRIGRETVTYVANIYKYYLTYQMMMQQQEARAQAKTGVGAASAPGNGG
jgi:membrane-bound lytic murein transglycosylase MltF